MNRIKLTLFRIVDHFKIYYINIRQSIVGTLQPINAFITLKSNIPHATAAKKIGQVPEITECYNIAGNNCVIMKVSTPTTRRLEAIIGQLQAIGETNTSVILSPTFERRIIRRN